MLENVSNPGGFLRTSRNFPASDVKQLATEIDKSYINIASVVNTCTRGMFPTTMPAITGEEWFITGNQKQQSLRQVYQITSTATFTHGLNIQSPNQFKRCWGSYTDGTGAYGLVWGDSVTVAGLITFYVTMTQIIFNVGAGVPAMTSGTVILEWLAQP
jgi:hypothetical protein